MRMPRFRFTVRRMMVAVAIVAVVLGAEVARRRWDRNRAYVRFAKRREATLAKMIGVQLESAERLRQWAEELPYSNSRSKLLAEVFAEVESLRGELAEVVVVRMKVGLPVANGQKTTLSLPVRRSVAQKWRISPCRDEFDRPGAFIPKLAAAVDFQDVGFGMRIRTRFGPIAAKFKEVSRAFRKRPESGRRPLPLFLVRLLREGRVQRRDQIPAKWDRDRPGDPEAERDEVAGLDLQG
jgi:hypothetical protein